MLCISRNIADDVSGYKRSTRASPFCWWISRLLSSRVAVSCCNTNSAQYAYLTHHCWHWLSIQFLLIAYRSIFLQLYWLLIKLARFGSLFSSSETFRNHHKTSWPIRNEWRQHYELDQSWYSPASWLDQSSSLTYDNNIACTRVLELLLTAIRH